MVGAHQQRQPDSSFGPQLDPCSRYAERTQIADTDSIGIGKEHIKGFSMAEQQYDAASSGSAFLDCLQKGQNTFAHVLLPKLIEQGSAVAVALSCTAMCKLCYDSIKKLNLVGLSCIAPSKVGQWVDRLPEHFPSCSSIQLRVAGDMSYQSVMYLLPALARLPKLTEVTMKVVMALQPLPMAMLLLVMRTQLTSLLSLQLDLEQSWADAEWAWKELACMTQLTSLKLTCYNEMSQAFCSKDNLLLLSSLSKLQCLELAIPFPSAEPGLCPVNMDLVLGLPHLTALALWTSAHISRLPGMTSIAACTDLQELSLTWAPGQHLLLDTQEWEALGQLTHLKCLNLWPVVVDGAACPAGCAALCQLTGLRVLGAEAWSVGMLTVLQRMSALIGLGGGWLRGEAPAGCRLPQVTQLKSTYGNIPVEAFRELRSVGLYNSMSTTVLDRLVKHCTTLEELIFDRWPEDWDTLSGEGIELDVQAPSILGMSALQGLTVLSFCPASQWEFMACVEAAAALLPHRLQCLNLVILPGALPVHGLLHVGKLCGLDQLYVRWRDIQMVENDCVAEGMVCAVGGIHSVHFEVEFPEDVEMLLDAHADAARYGFKVPAEFKVELIAD